MKRWIFSFLVFPLTLAAGYLLATFPGSTEPACLQATTQNEAVLSTGSLTIKDDFKPEYADLIDLEDLDWPDYSVELIDVFQHGNAYRKSEVIAKNGESWFGLFEEKGKFSLRQAKTKVKIDRSYTGYGDEDYVRLKTEHRKQPVFLIKDLKALKAGPVGSLYLRPHWNEISERNLPIKSMSVGYREEFWLGDKNYVLRVTLGMTRKNEKVNVLVLESQGVSEIVTYNRHFRDANSNYDIIGDLLWVGDLDGDGKLDLYFDDFGYEKGGFSSGLYLSSEAKKDELVRQVASFGTAGC